MNILQMEDMVKGLPDDRLMQEAQNPTGQMPQFLLVSEVQRRADMRKRFASEQQEQPQGTITQQILGQAQQPTAPPQAPPSPAQQSGIGALQAASPQQPPVQPMAAGGLVSLKGGGWIDEAMKRGERMSLMDIPADTAMTPTMPSFRPERNKLGQDTLVAYQDVTNQMPVTPWQYDYAGNQLPKKEGLGDIWSGAKETWKSMAQDYFAGDKGRDPIKVQIEAEQVNNNPPVVQQSVETPQGNMYTRAADARQAAYDRGEVATLANIRDNTDWEGIGMSLKDTAGKLGNEIFPPGLMDKVGPVVDAVRNVGSEDWQEAHPALAGLGSLLQKGVASAQGSPWIPDDLTENPEANSEENAAKNAAPVNKADGAIVAGATKGTEVVMGGGDPLEALLDESGYSSAEGGISRLENASLEYADLVEQAKADKLDLSESIEGAKKAAWGTYLMNLGAGIAGGDMSEGMKLGARSMAEQMQDVRRMQMAEQQSGLEASQGARQLELAGRTSDFQQQKEVAEMEIREREKKMDYLLAKYGIDIKKEEAANWRKKNELTEVQGKINALADYADRLDTQAEWAETDEEAAALRLKAKQIMEQIGMMLGQEPPKRSDQLPRG